MNDKDFMREAIALSLKNIEEEGGPFGAVIVKDGNIIAKGTNRVTANNDPTAHAEINAIRKAAQQLGTFDLSGCRIYSSCEPCPMCLGAIYWARLEKVVYACKKEDAAQISFDDDDFYGEMAKDMEDRQIDFEELMREKALPLFNTWKEKPDKTNY